MSELSVVVPLYCEEKNLNDFLQKLWEILPGVATDFEVVLVDDGSVDRTWELVTQASQSYPELRAVKLSRNFGKEAALCAGLDSTTGNAIIIMDGDFQHPPELIPRLVEIWRVGDVDVVEGVKSKRGRESFITRWGSRAFYSILRVLSGFDIRDHTDFKLVDRRVLEAWKRLGERNLFFRGMIRWLGFRRETVLFGVGEADRSSRWSFLELVRLATTGLTSFSSLPLQFMSLLGVVLSIPAMGLLIHTLWRKLSGSAVDGFTTVISLQLLIGSSLMLGIGLLGTYVARIHDEVKARPRYLVSNSLGFD
jgi:glycosyltransferase involved in cell wall biosynthesis